jgi:hypothetical protein
MLTREQINEFMELSARLPNVDRHAVNAFHWRVPGPPFFRIVKDGFALTPAGHDLLATIPHLPPEPEPVAAVPACSRCNGETTVPLFMGPMSGGATMPCPACSNGDSSPTVVASCGPFNLAGADDNWMWRGSSTGGGEAAGIVGRMHSEWVTATGLPRGFLQVDTRATPSGGWTLIDSEETARSFVGATVEVNAAAGDGWDTHPAHESTKQVIDGRAAGLLFADGMIINWSARGNVRLRRVAP